MNQVEPDAMHGGVIWLGHDARPQRPLVEGAQPSVVVSGHDAERPSAVAEIDKGPQPSRSSSARTPTSERPSRSRRGRQRSARNRLRSARSPSSKVFCRGRGDPFASARRWPGKSSRSAGPWREFEQGMPVRGGPDSGRVAANPRRPRRGGIRRRARQWFLKLPWRR